MPYRSVKQDRQRRWRLMHYNCISGLLLVVFQDWCSCSHNKPRDMQRQQTSSQGLSLPCKLEMRPSEIYEENGWTSSQVTLWITFTFHKHKEKKNPLLFLKKNAKNIWWWDNYGLLDFANPQSILITIEQKRPWFNRPLGYYWLSKLDCQKIRKGFEGNVAPWSACIFCKMSRFKRAIFADFEGQFSFLKSFWTCQW